MKAIARLRILGIGALVGVFALGTSAQTPAAAPASAAAAPPAAEAVFTSAQLEQLAAPIALYPDSLVTQILMASTYPLEVVEAARWVKANPSLKGKELEAALLDQDWDVAVKALCGIPEALTQMNDNLDWTQDLGDAFLAQRADLLDAVQRMRGKAYEAGSLKTTEQQTVTQQPDKIIVIQSADPQVVYVPTYSPTVVYGGWSYPSYYYPSMYYPPPYAYGYGYGAMAFTAGVFWGAALSGGCNWGWGGGDVDIDINRNNEFNRNTNRNSNRTNASDRSGNRAGAKGGKGSFQHNPEHRGGVNYRDNKTAQKFGGQGNSNRVTRDQARGYDRGGAGGQRGGASASNRAAGGAGQRGGAGASNRASGGAGGGLGASNRAGGGASASNRAAGGASNRQTGASTRGSGASSRSGASSSRNSAYSGSRNSGFDRSSSSRGSSSRSGGYSGGRGGGGGGRGGGGGGRRR
jgi:hypothetical protein